MCHLAEAQGKPPPLVRARRLVSFPTGRGTQGALEDAGVQFIEENGGGSGVRMKDRSK
jgi:hypothetical protein